MHSKRFHTLRQTNSSSLKRDSLNTGRRSLRAITHKAAQIIKDFIGSQAPLTFNSNNTHYKVQGVTETAVWEVNLLHCWRFWGVAENATIFLTTPYSLDPTLLLNYDCV